MADPASAASRAEIERHFVIWRAATEKRDFDRMATLLSVDARGGNSVFGIMQGREEIVEFIRTRWPAEIPNRSLWVAIDGRRVVNKWCETLPGVQPPGRSYTYEGISEFLYAGEHQWNFMYGIPDVVGLERAYESWREDGQAEIFGELYPELRGAKPRA